MVMSKDEEDDTEKGEEEEQEDWGADFGNFRKLNENSFHFSDF